MVRRGWLVYERYFGRGHREATPNTASCGKSFTSIAVGILLKEKPDLFPDGLDQQVFTPRYFPAEAFPLSDPAKPDIRLGQLLAMTAGIRGNNPCYVHGRPVTIQPAGPDGFIASTDAVALGKRAAGELNCATLWCKPGEGYSYATASPHLASIMLRHVAGMELQQFIDERLAKPMGWGHWGWGYRRPEVAHTPGGGGIALRATDMLRFGYLLLRRGRWAGRQLVPADYVRHCSRRSPYNRHFPYSLQFEVSGGDRGFWKSGSGGHCLYVVPAADLVVFKLGGRDEQYDSRNTGLPAPEGFTYDGSREGWKAEAAADASTAAGKTLELVLRAVD